MTHGGSLCNELSSKYVEHTSNQVSLPQMSQWWNMPPNMWNMPRIMCNALSSHFLMLFKPLLHQTSVLQGVYSWSSRHNAPLKWNVHHQVISFYQNSAPSQGVPPLGLSFVICHAPGLLQARAFALLHALDLPCVGRSCSRLYLTPQLAIDHVLDISWSRAKINSKKNGTRTALFYSCLK